MIANDMNLDLPNWVEGQTLSPSRVLLPLFEAIVNAIQSVADARKAGLDASNVTVRAVREGLFINDPTTKPYIRGFCVEDDGIGFDDENYHSFCTVASMKKKQIGGLGVGRLSYLKAYQRAEVSSKFFQGESLVSREFVFDLAFTSEPLPPSPATGDRGTCVTLKGLKEPYENHIPDDPEIIAEKIIEHCLPQLLSPDSPTVTLVDGPYRKDLRQLAREMLEGNGSVESMGIDGHEFQVIVYRALRGKHAVHLTANGRTVTSHELDLTRKGLPATLGESKYVIQCYVSGQLLDSTVRRDRTNFDLGRKAQPGFPGTDDIKRGAATVIDRVCAEDIAPADERKYAQAEKLIRDEPELRILGPLLKQILSELPVDDLPKMKRALIVRAAEERQDRSERLAERMSKLENPSLEEADREQQIDRILTEVTESEKDALARYVGFRRLMIEILQQNVSMGEEGKYPYEAAVHNHIFPMRKEGHQIRVTDHQLWLIDERLAFHHYLASDVRFDSMSQLQSDSKDRPDILIWDKVHVLGASSDDALHSVVLVEFKRPERDDYKAGAGGNPIDQITDQIARIQEGLIKDWRGRTFRLQEGGAVYAYIVADLTPHLTQMLKVRDFTRTPDGMGYFSYINNLSAYIEVISYSKMLKDAKERNRALFDKLNIIPA